MFRLSGGIGHQLFSFKMNSEPAAMSYVLILNHQDMYSRIYEREIEEQQQNLVVVNFSSHLLSFCRDVI